MSQTEPETVLSPAPETDAQGVTAGARPRPGFFRRVMDFYTCRTAREKARAGAAASLRELELLSRAKAAFATGNLLREPLDPSRKRLAGAHAGALYAESLTWALRSFDGDGTRAASELFTSNAGVIRELALPPEDVESIAQLLGTPNLSLELGERTEREQDRAANLLKRAALVAIDLRDRPLRAVDGVNLVAAARVALTVLVLALLVSGAVALRPEKPNLAAGKPWRTSSTALECHPQQADCGGVKTRIFFHTKEEQNPWLEYDLGTKTTFSSMLIENRKDGVGERAVPLVVEVGDDGSHYRQVARQDKDFSTWKPSFPSVTARYVRLRVPRFSILHLEEVDIYR